MNKTFAVLVSGLFLLAIFTGVAFAQSEGKTIVDKSCAKCHNTKRIESANKNGAEWEATLDRMIKKGADVKPAEKAAVLHYLNSLNR